MTVEPIVRWFLHKYSTGRKILLLNPNQMNRIGCFKVNKNRKLVGVLKSNYTKNFSAFTGITSPL